MLLRENARFRALWFSNLFFFGGVWTQTLVLGWLVFETTRSELLVAVFTAVRLAPMLLGPLTGAFADRHDRVRLLAVAAFWALLTAGVFSALIGIGRAPYGVLLLGGLAIGLAQSPSQPARASLVLDLVGRRNLSKATALNAMAMNMTQVVGPAVGGLMISTLGVAAALWVSTAWYALSLALLLPLRGAGRRHEQASRAQHGSTVAMVVSGFRVILANRLATTTLLVTVAANLLLWPIFQGFMPVLAQRSLGLDAAGLGWLLTCAGAGGLVGSLVIARLGDFRFKGGLFVGGTAVWAALWAVFALTRDVPTAFVLMGAIGVASAAFGILQNTLLLTTTAPDVHGRVLGVQELAIGVMPVASLVLGVAAERFGISATTFVSAVLLVVLLAALSLWTPRLLGYSGIADDDPVEAGAHAEASTAPATRSREPSACTTPPGAP